MSERASARSIALYWKRARRRCRTTDPCEKALTRVGAEPAPTGKPVDLGPLWGSFLGSAGIASQTG